MPSNFSFTGALFTVRSATPLSSVTVRLAFSQPPLRINSAGVNDALNKNNYVVSGPNAVSIVSIAPVITDISAIDITFNTALSYGSWAIAVSNVQTPTGGALSAPTSASFTIATLQTSLVAGSEVETTYDVIRKHLNGALAGPNWDALISALATGDDYSSELSRNAFIQLFLSTALGSYLDENAADDGNRRPANVGMSDDDFRELAIELANGRVVYSSLLRILQSYYGKEALRGYIDTQSGPFNLRDGQTLVLNFEGEIYTFTIDERSFRSVSAATPQELAVALAIFFKYAKLEAIASVIVDPNTGLEKVRIYSPSLGLRSAVSVVGGTAQPFLGFDTKLNVYSATITNADNYNWVYSVVNGRTQIRLTTVGVPKIDIASVLTDDYVVIGTDIGVAAGWYPIYSVAYEWSGGNYIQTVTLSENIGFTGTLVQQSNLSYSFYRPTVHNILNGERTVVVSNTTDGILDIQVPAVASVYRNSSNAAYIAGNNGIDVMSIERKNGTVRAILNSAHGLSVGDQVWIDNYQPGLGRPWMGAPSAGFLGGSWLQGIASTGNISGSASDTAAAESGLVKLSNGNIVIFGGIDGTFSYTNKTFQVAFTASTTINDNTQAQGATNVGYTITTLGNTVVTRATPSYSVLNGAFSDVILATGGTVIGSATATTEALVAGVWSARSSMSTGRVGHGQVTLPSGEVLVIGGINSGGVGIATCEIYNPFLNLWTSTGSLSVARAHGQYIVLPDGSVLAIGGRNTANEALRIVERWDPNTGTWTAVSQLGWKRKLGFVKQISSTELIVFGGSGRADGTTVDAALTSTEIYNIPNNTWRIGPTAPANTVNGTGWGELFANKIYIGDNTSRQYHWLDLSTMEWNAYPALGRLRSSAIAGDFGVLLTGFSFAESPTRYFDFVFGNGVVTSPQGINGMQKVSNVVSSTVFEFQTPVTAYSTTLNNKGTLQASGSSFANGWDAISITRNAGIVTVTITVPEGTLAVHINSTDANFPSGLKLLTSRTDTTISYTEAGANSSGTVSVAIPLMVPEITAVGAEGTEGIFVLDKTSVTYHSGDTTLSTNLNIGTNYGILEVASTADFPDEEGWVILNLGTATESNPIKYLEKISPTQLLLAGFAATYNWPIGSTVTRISLTPSDDIEGAFWITGSLAAGVAAKQDILESTARDVDINWTVIYPGDRGLGGEGQSNSDAPTVWGPDDEEI